jgi:hypothetical protein
MQEVPDVVLISDSAGAAAIQLSVIDVAIVRRHENGFTSWIEDVVIVERWQPLVFDSTGLERGVKGECPQSALTVQV